MRVGLEVLSRRTARQALRWAPHRWRCRWRWTWRAWRAWVVWRARRSRQRRPRALPGTPPVQWRCRSESSPSHELASGHNTSQRLYWSMKVPFITSQSTLNVLVILHLVMLDACEKWGKIDLDRRESLKMDRLVCWWGSDFFLMCSNLKTYFALLNLYQFSPQQPPRVDYEIPGHT